MLAAVAPAILIAISFIGRSFVPMMVERSGMTDRMLIEWGPNWVAVFTKSFLTNADTFAVGMLAAILIVAMEQDVVRERLSRRVRLYSVLGLLPALVGTAFLLKFANHFATTGIAILCTLMLLDHRRAAGAGSRIRRSRAAWTVHRCDSSVKSRCRRIYGTTR